MVPREVSYKEVAERQLLRRERKNTVQKSWPMFRWTWLDVTWRDPLQRRSCWMTRLSLPRLGLKDELNLTTCWLCQCSRRSKAFPSCSTHLRKQIEQTFDPVLGLNFSYKVQIKMADLDAVALSAPSFPSSHWPSASVSSSSNTLPPQMVTVAISP